MPPTKKLGVRVDDDLYTAVFDAAHDERKSMNQFITDLLVERVKPRPEIRSNLMILLDEESIATRATQHVLADKILATLKVQP